LTQKNITEKQELELYSPDQDKTVLTFKYDGKNHYAYAALALAAASFGGMISWIAKKKTACQKYPSMLSFFVYYIKTLRVANLIQHAEISS
jgi:hypothetical protein